MSNKIKGYKYQAARVFKLLRSTGMKTGLILGTLFLQKNRSTKNHNKEYIPKPKKFVILGTVIVASPARNMH